MKPKKFIEQLKPDALKIQKEYGIPAAVIIAQAALESGWLKHPIKDKNTGQYSYNLFGIKADRSWKGKTVTIDTHEFVNGKRTRVEDEFRAYDSYQESILDHMQFLFDNPRYKETLETNDPKEFARRLQDAGYATDPKYADKLISIMRTHNLLELSEQDPQEFSDMGSDHWAYAAAVRLKEEGIITGYDDGSYRPGKELTRAELAVVLDKLRTTILEEVN